MQNQIQKNQSKIKKREICSVCANEKLSKYCEFCRRETPSNLSVEVFEKVRLRGLFTLKFREAGRKVKAIIRSGWKKSGDPRLSEGVYEDRIIDRLKNAYHQVVKDARTGTILHEEHEKLTDHGVMKK